MTLPIRQTFLPSGIKESEIRLRKFDFTSYPLKLDRENCGFDHSGKYFTIFSDERFVDPKAGFIKIVVLDFNEEKIDSSVIKIQMKYPVSGRGYKQLGAVEYNPLTNHCFILDGLFGDSRELWTENFAKVINVYHIYLKPYLGSSRMVEIESQSENQNRLVTSG